MTGQSYFVYRTPLGRVAIESDGAAITRFAFGPAKLGGVQRATALTNQASSQVLEYLAGKRTAFDVPLRAQGTPFQLEVWDALSAIPYGQTRTYAEIAQAIGRPKALQAVGQACGRNPLPLFVPCHRVVGAAGKLGGYAFGPAIKRFLLDLEARGIRVE